ncbi:MAG: hypothetical protein JXR70_07915 [Spirochaetales bacterium]|nr:hypothetical protein [Spirochaetales bacterium]
MNQKELSIIDPENINFFYKMTCDEIQKTKNAQWHTVYFMVLLNILAVSFVKLVPLEMASSVLKYSVVSVISLVTLVSMIYLVYFQNELVKFDFRLRRIHKHMPKDKYLILEKMSLSFSSSSFYFFGVVLPFISVLFVLLGGSIALILL